SWVTPFFNVIVADWESSPLPGHPKPSRNQLDDAQQACRQRSKSLCLEGYCAFKTSAAPCRTFCRTLLANYFSHNRTFRCLDPQKVRSRIKVRKIDADLG